MGLRYGAPAPNDPEEVCLTWKGNTASRALAKSTQRLHNSSMMKSDHQPDRHRFRQSRRLSSSSSAFSALVRAWCLEYHGNAHELLLEAIDELHLLEVAKNYAKIIPITQLSGTGKSKTVDKVAMSRILLPLCLHEDLATNDFGARHHGFWIVVE